MRLRAILAILAVAAASAEEPIELRFGPADGAVWKTSATTSRELTLGDKPRNDEAVVEMTRRFVKTDSGYEVKTVTDLSSITSNGFEISNPMMSASLGVELDYIVEADGRCSDVRGYDRVLEAIKTKLPGPFFQQMAPLFNAAGLRQRDLNVWNAQFAGMAGRRLRPGDIWVERKVASVPNGSAAPYHEATVVEGWADCGEGRCLKLRTVADSDSERLGKTLGEGGPQAIKAAKGSEPAGAVLKIPVQGEGERIFDPATLRIESETSELSYAGEADFPGRGVETFQVVERRKFSTELVEP